MASTFGAAFDKLDRQVQRNFTLALGIRKARYLRAMNLEDIKTKFIILGDTPGPARPADPNYHHTPFYSTKNSSLWMNRQLIEAGVNEVDLVWFNALLANNSSLPAEKVTSLLRHNPEARIICLGGKAEEWVKKNLHGQLYTKVFHPQFAKRFKSKEPYLLINELVSNLETA